MMQSRGEQKEQSRAVRQQTEREEQERARRRKRLHLALPAIVALVVVAGVGGLLLSRTNTRQSSMVPGAPIPPVRTLDLMAAAQAAHARFISCDYGYGINAHTAKRVTYPTNPPTNGPHAFAPAQDGN